MTGSSPDRFILTYVPLPRVWCTRPRCSWSKELPSLDTAAVDLAKSDHLAAAHTPDDIGNAGP